MPDRTRLGAFLVLLGSIVLAPVTTVRAGEEAHVPLEVEVVTFNIRYGTANDGANAWPHRREAVLDYLDDCDADFIGLQEALSMQSDLVKARLEGDYDMIIRTREKRDGEGEATPLLYRRDRWRLDPERHGTFWLSETPDVPASRSWQTSLPRIATWGRFEDRSTGRPVWVFNTHFDHRSAAARLGAARLIASRIARLVPAQEPVIVMGDLNATPESPPLATLLSGGGRPEAALVDAWRISNPAPAPECTFNGWGPGLDGRRIDHVLVRKGAEVKRSSIVRRFVEGRPISDHWPVDATVTFPATVTTETGQDDGS